MIFTIILCCMVGQYFAATTMNPTTKHHAHHHTGTHPTHAHRTRPTVEHWVSDSFVFRYDPNTHLMLASQHQKCFIYTMNGQESTEVHTPHGLHELEKSIITIIDAYIYDTSRTFITMSQDAVMAASKTFAHLCNKNGTTTFKLN
ncbi:uncharacterized protein LOC134687799 [Mytilus trossulus]|uniref:uncharacterized protein LOC134687799 n=1 Tax=Mytilus trossulus TaxID=6551 RepID=UPI00300557DF